jgi:general L-amino acid transport system substrate-binding protein
MSTRARNTAPVDRGGRASLAARCPAIGLWARGLSLSLAALATAGLVGAAWAGPTLDRVKASGTIRCGAVARPGLLDQKAEGTPGGLLVDLCRAIGVAAAGSSVTVRATVYDSDNSYDEVRAGRDDVFFLSGAEIVEQRLADFVAPGPPVFHQTIALMAAGDSAARRPDDLANQSICFLQGDASHHRLEAYFAAKHLPFIRMGYQEEDEMRDAFDAQQCRAMAGEATTLAAARRKGGKTLRSARILAEPLASFPIFVATAPSDGAWTALAFWTVDMLIDADRPKRDWAAGGLDGLPIDAPALGLAQGWRERVLAATGGYAEIFRRNVGDASPLDLPLGPNALASEGGLMAPPDAE